MTSNWRKIAIAIVGLLAAAVHAADTPDDLYDRTMTKLSFSPAPGGFLVSAAEMPGFLEVALEREVVDIWRGEPLASHWRGESLNPDAGVRYALKYRRDDIRRLDYDRASLLLPPRMYDYFRSTRYTRLETDAYDRLAIIVHEPHWSLSEQYQMLEGVRHLMSANATQSFAFLVEGDFENLQREFDPGEIDTWLGDGPMRRSLVLRLLQEYIIDGPLAYRLLADDPIPGLAIDSPPDIAATPRAVDLLTIIESITRLRTALMASTEEIMGHVFAVDLAAELARGASQDLAEFDRAEAALDALVAAVEQFAPDQELIDMADVDVLRDDLHSMRRALRRDEIMSEHINRFLRDRREIPIIFVGSFHTEGIISRLPSNTAALVLEPRQFREETAEFLRFQDAVHDRTAYMRRWLDRLKLPVVPHQETLPLVREGIQVETDRVGNWERRVRGDSPFSSEINEQLLAAFRNCGTLLGIDIDFAAERDAEVPGLGRAFAAYVPRRGDEPPRFMIYDRSLSNWRHRHRIDLLAELLIAPPFARTGRRARIAWYETPDRSLAQGEADELHAVIMEHAGPTDPEHDPADDAAGPSVRRRRLHPNRSYFLAIYDAPTRRVFLYDGIDPGECYGLLNPRQQSDVNPFLRVDVLE